MFRHHRPARPRRPRRRSRRACGAPLDGPAADLLGLTPGRPEALALDDRTDERITLDFWELTAGPAHPVHLHLVHFKVLSRNNGEPLPTDAGWKDTVDLTAGERAAVIARFNGWRGRYTFHCHNLEHEDMMMMANFEVV